ncbi:MAG: hypothetical protein ACRD8O_20975 [Bryobacteraceae bacterium]
MKIAINLASEPFRRDRPVIAGSFVVGALLAGLLGLLIYLSLTERTQLAETHATIDRLNASIRAVATEQEKIEAVIRRPENAEVFERSVFLNSLLTRKGISWTQIFADLEKTLPHNVRVISIRPWMNSRSQVNLDMNVGSEQTEPLIELLKRLESSDLFGRTSVSNRLPPTQNEPMYRYRVNVNYAQKF